MREVRPRLWTLLGAVLADFLEEAVWVRPLFCSIRGALPQPGQATRGSFLEADDDVVHFGWLAPEGVSEKAQNSGVPVCVSWETKHS